MEITNDLVWICIYWVRGKTPRASGYINEITDPPCSGWQHALVIKGPVRSTIFCPYSFTSYSIRSIADEIVKSKEPKDQRDSTWIINLMQRKWEEFQNSGFQRDYQTAAIIFKKLGVPVPDQKLRGGLEDTRKKGGKEVGTVLLKPIKFKSKRGRFLKYFMDNDKICSIGSTS